MSAELTNKEYTEELEKVVIFLCDVYSKYQDSISCQTGESGMADEAWLGVYMHLPTIQGLGNRVQVDKIGKFRTQRLNREAPKISFKELYERLNRDRRDT